MFGLLLRKELKFAINEQRCLDEILSSRTNAWFTAQDKTTNTGLDFVRDKPDCQFYLSRIKNFPNTLAEVLMYVPDLNVKNSYITKCSPGYSMQPHIDQGRSTAIIVPLGTNKGQIKFYINGLCVYTHIYTGPTLTRVDIKHSAINSSLTYRYSVTLEVPGSYLRNLFLR